MSNYIKNTAAFAKKNAKYSDISIGFGINPFSKDLTRVTDVDAVKRSVRSLVLTDKFERLLDPDIGGNIRAALFEPMSPLTESILEDYITETIENYEPRCILESVIIQANYDNNAYNVTITFRVDTSEGLQSLSFLLERVR
jgi:phage baseplate assembly protein W